jgi:preprotein translocase subunit SecG
MGTLVFILSIVAAVLLMLVILIQNPKGGGIDSSFGAANQLGSVKKTNDVVEKATWYLAIFIVVLALSSSLLISKKTGVEQVTTESKLDTSFTPAVNPDAVQLPPEGPAQ